MTRRRDIAALVVDLLDQTPGIPVHLTHIYELVEAARPDLADDELDSSGRSKWQHDVRWELQTGVLSTRVTKREDIGRGYYSGGLVAGGTAEPRQTRVRVAPIERVRPEPILVITPARSQAAQKREGELVHRYENWCNSRGRAIGRAEIRTAEGDRIVADAYDVHRHLLLEAKAKPDRPSVRMAIGQLYDYSASMEVPPLLALLVPSEPVESLCALLRNCGIGLVVEDGQLGFKEALIARHRAKH